MTESELQKLLADTSKELQGAAARYPAMNSAHEGYAVLLEEVDELWEQVKVRQGLRLVHKMYAECIQVAAMALRFAHDICNSDRGQK